MFRKIDTRDFSLESSIDGNHVKKPRDKKNWFFLYLMHKCHAVRFQNQILQSATHQSWKLKRPKLKQMTLSNWLLSTHLKHGSSVFRYFTKTKHLKNHEKCFLFYQKSSFRSQDIQIFVLCSSALFSLLGHCWVCRRSWLKINKILQFMTSSSV